MADLLELIIGVALIIAVVAFVAAWLWWIAAISFGVAVAAFLLRIFFVDRHY